MTLPALGMESASLSFELKAEAEGSIARVVFQGWLPGN